MFPVLVRQETTFSSDLSALSGLSLAASYSPTGDFRSLRVFQFWVRENSEAPPGLRNWAVEEWLDQQLWRALAVAWR